MEPSQQAPRRIAVIEGDGAGPELLAAVRRVLAGLLPEASVETVDIGDGGDVPTAALERLRAADLVVKGPLASRQDGHGVSRNVRLRAAVGGSVQVRHAAWLGAHADRPSDLDVLVVRDTSEGLFAGLGAHAGSEEAGELIAALQRIRIALPTGAGVSLKFASPVATARLWEVAVDVAVTTGRRELLAVHKAAAVPHADRVLLEVGREVVARRAAAGAPVELLAAPVDAVCARLAAGDPSCSLLVTTALYGDICADVAGAVTGGVRHVGGVSLGAEPVLAEAAHGVVQAHAGAGTADPTGLLRSVGLALELGGWPAPGAALLAAVRAAAAEGGDEPAGRTARVGDAVMRAYESSASSSRSATGTSGGSATT